ncbi:MAG: hypothetical protein AAF721_30200, partial [Myxococcota bacterium]
MAFTGVCRCNRCVRALRARLLRQRGAANSAAEDSVHAVLVRALERDLPLDGPLLSTMLSRER